ncbi:MAG: alpha/beta hydrolase [Treponema sp.]|nr:alpha/beta hydrolase [Treponema sp.]
MRNFCEAIWEDGEYNYEAAYGFVPNVHAYLHEEGIRDCLLVVPGGGYCMCVPPEGEIVATEFYKKGLNVFVLTYTTDITMSVPLKRQPLADIARAVRFIRSRAGDYSLGKKLFVCGFSAGAHVCGTLAVHSDDVADKNAAYSGISCRPDGAILCYPVITTGTYTHASSVEALLGKHPSADELKYFSLEKNVTEKTPPCFLWQTATDDLVPVENSYLFARALKEKGMPFAHYVFPHGFHGLSVASKDFFKGKFGDPYTMEQVRLAVQAVKDGKGINVSPQRQAELKAQFPDTPLQNEGHTNSQSSAAPEEYFTTEAKQYEDVQLWTTLAEQWMKRV